MPSANDVIDFWFPEPVRPSPERPDGGWLEAWFRPSAAFDEEIRARFHGTWEAAAAGLLDGWQATAEGALALVVALDQFPRNMFRGDPRAFASDAQALAAAGRALERGLDARVPRLWRTFFYLPFEHAEDPAAQARSVALFRALGEPETLRYAELHKEIVDRFGRFPHRNAILGRESTPEEEAWLRGGGETFGTRP
jgi:uncharacterized protein (DUF924 family)